MTSALCCLLQNCNFMETNSYDLFVSPVGVVYDNELNYVNEYANLPGTFQIMLNSVHH